MPARAPAAVDPQAQHELTRLGALVRARRQDLRIAAGSVAAAANLSRQTLHRIEHGEFRESRNDDFLASDLTAYRALRGRVSQDGMGALFRAPITPLRDIRLDQYGIRTLLEVDGVPIKFEIVLEARITLDPPAADALCGVRTLSALDQVSEKLPANANRWADDAVDARDLIDLAMMLPRGRIPRAALDKARKAYADALPTDLRRQPSDA